LSSEVQTATVPVSGEHNAPAAQRRWRRWRPDILGVLAVLLIALVLGQRLLGPEISTPGDRVSAFQPFNAIAPRAVRNWIVLDVVQQAYPNRKFVNTELQHGHFPLWNPYILTGHPFVADPIGAMFYPTTLAFGWLSAGHALDMEMIIHLFISTLGMYILVRVWGGKQVGAVAAAAAFAGCSTLTVWQQYGNILTSASWLPWIVACFALAQRSRRLLWIGAGGIAMGLFILANDVQWLLYDLIFLGCYAAWVSITLISKRTWHRVITGYVDQTPINESAAARGGGRAFLHPLVNMSAIVIIGFGIGAVQLLPEWELTGQSPRGVAHLPYAAVLAYAAPPERLLTTLAPNFLGTPAVLGSEWYTRGTNYPEDLVYWGFFPLLLALTAPLWRRTSLVWFLWAFLLFIASMVFGTPVLHLYALVPKLSLLEVARMGYLMCFVGAALCGVVFDRVFADPRPWRPLLVIGGLALIGQGILHLVLARPHARPALTLQPTQESLRWVTLLALVGIIIFVVAMVRWRFARLVASLALALLIIVDMVHFSLPYNAATGDEQTLFPHLQVFDALPHSVAPVRVVPINDKNNLAKGILLLPPDILEAFGIADLGAYENLLPAAYEQYFRQIEPTPFQYNGHILVISQDTSPLLDLAGAEYFVSMTPLDTTKKPLQLVATAQTLYLYRNPQAAPRAFITTNVTAVNSISAALQTLTSPGFTPCGVATVEAANLSLPLPAQPGCTGTATITAYEPNAVRIHAQSPTDGFLVLSDAYYPGWQVTVDGEGQPLYRADGVFRGVRIPAGDHDVRFMFRPMRVIAGGSLSAVALLGAIFLIGIGVRLRNHRIPESGYDRSAH